MENPRIFIVKILVVWYDLQKQSMVQRQISRGGQQPTIPQLSLLHIEPGVTLDEKLRIIADFLQVQRFVTSPSSVYCDRLT